LGGAGGALRRRHRGKFGFHQPEGRHQPGIGAARRARLQRAEARIEQDCDDQQSAGEYHVGADEQPAMAGHQPLFQVAISQASGTSK